MTTEVRKFALLDPTVEPLPDSTELALRPGDLNGKVVGLLANGKRNADKLLDNLYSLLQDTYDFGGVVRLNKRDPTRPAPEQIINELLESCDLVVTATGD